MKKVTFLAALISTAISYSGAFAQGQQDRSLASRDHLIIRHLDGAGLSEDAAARPAPASAINLRAIKDFKRRFGTVSDAKWYPTSAGFYSYFVIEGATERVFYDKKGRWMSSIKYCDGNALPHDVRDQVRRAYLDFTIFSVEIVDVPEHRVYLVYIEDSTSWKIIRVNDEGEMDVLHDYLK